MGVSTDKVRLSMVVNPDLACTDELSTEFYECPLCEFQRVPRAHDRYLDLDEYTKWQRTAHYCPGCGRPVIWRELL